MGTGKQLTDSEVWTKERQLFKAVTESTPLIAWATDVIGSCYYMSPEWHRFTGFDDNEGLGFNWLLAIHPEDRDRVRQAFFGAQDTRTAYGCAYRLVRPDGTYSLAWAVGLPKFNDENQFEGFFGTVFPIVGQYEKFLIDPSAPEIARRLSEREREVLQLIAAGQTSEEVAQVLGITRRTVETHVANAGVKLGGLNRVHTVVQALKFNEIERS